MFSNKDPLPNRGTIQVKNIRGNPVNEAGTVQEPPKPIVIAPQEVNRCGTEIGDAENPGTTESAWRQGQCAVSRDLSRACGRGEHGRMMRNVSQQQVTRSTTEKLPTGAKEDTYGAYAPDGDAPCDRSIGTAPSTTNRMTTQQSVTHLYQVQGAGK